MAEKSLMEFVPPRCKTPTIDPMPLDGMRCPVCDVGKLGLSENSVHGVWGLNMYGCGNEDCCATFYAEYVLKLEKFYREPTEEEAQ